jgi:putative zinc finger/helix-turn-helix YgiT family protein
MNTPPKPIKTLAGKTCRHCQQGKFELVQITHVENVAQDNPLTIPDVWVDRCNHCGEIIFPGDTVHYIETVVAEETEQLTGQDLEHIREILGVLRQDEMSEILGLGKKTFHKWESGSQVPTRSMSYYIRVLEKFPEAFEWLRARGWHGRNRLTTTEKSPLLEMQSRFPALAANPSRLNSVMTSRINYAGVLFAKA